MKHVKNSRRFKLAGLTLIELMVSLVIGLLLAIVASSTYLYSKQAYNAVTETSQMEESGRFALNLLTRNIQSAGFVMFDPVIGEPTVKDIKVSGCSFGMVAPQTAGSFSDLGCLSSTPAGTTQSGSIAMFYQADAFDTGGASYQGVDCIGGRPVRTPSIKNGGTDTFEVKSYFFISRTTVQTSNGTTTMGQLSCVTDSTGSASPLAFPKQPIIPGVHQLRALYILSELNNKSINAPPQKLFEADAVTSTNRWKDVVAVDLCVLTMSIQPSGNDTSTSTTDCYGTVFTPPPNVSYRRFTTTVNLRNRSGP